MDDRRDLNQELSAAARRDYRWIRARATDAAGNVQPEVPPWNRLGYGNNAIEVSCVDADTVGTPTGGGHS